MNTLDSTRFEKVAQRRDRLKGMPTPAQLESTQLADFAAKAGPPGLIGRIGLLNGKAPQCLHSGQRLQEWPPCSGCRGKKYDGPELHGSRRQAVAALAQIHLEFPDSTASADDRRLPDHGCVAAVYPAQRVRANVHKVRHAR